MSDTRYPGRAPWDEVWFLEGVDASGAGFWLRGTIHDGVDPHVGVWAVWDGGEEPVRSWASLPLATVGTRGARLAHPDLELTADRFRGVTPRVRWDLRLEATVTPVPLVPALLERLGVGRTYEPVMPAARVRGTLEVDGATHAIDGSGVLGHLFGGRSRVASWGWCHAHDLAHDPPVVVEVLSARLGRPGRALPALTSVVVHWGDEVTALTSPTDLVRTRAHLGHESWRVRARHAGVDLAVEIGLGPAAHTTLARYDDPEGQPSWCRNTTHGLLSVRLADGARVRRWRTERALAELAGRVRPDGVVQIPLR
ncbi:MAG: hypothetical protein H6732_08910 [Alphaproteobacteria bacterium]|nr:hypothetical protein [Alphaproteobacteria bacterium]